MNKTNQKWFIISIIIISILILSKHSRNSDMVDTGGTIDLPGDYGSGGTGYMYRVHTTTRYETNTGCAEQYPDIIQCGFEDGPVVDGCPTVIYQSCDRSCDNSCITNDCSPSKCVYDSHNGKCYYSQGSTTYYCNVKYTPNGHFFSKGGPIYKEQPGCGWWLEVLDRNNEIVANVSQKDFNPNWGGTPYTRQSVSAFTNSSLRIDLPSPLYNPSVPAYYEYPDTHECMVINFITADERYRYYGCAGGYSWCSQGSVRQVCILDCKDAERDDATCTCKTVCIKGETAPNCDGKIDSTELINYVKNWLNNHVQLTDLISVINKYILG